MTWRPAAIEPPRTPPSVVGEGRGSRSVFSVICVFRHLADSAGFSSMSRFLVLHIRERMPVSRASPASQASSPSTARCGPAIEGVIAVAGAAGSGTASARRAQVACSRPIPSRSAEVAPGAAAPGLAHEPELAAAACGGGGINTAMGLDDPAGPGGDSDAVEIDGPLPAAPIEMARSGSVQDEPCAQQEAAPVSRSQCSARATSRPPPPARRRQRARRARTSRSFSAMTTRTFPPPRWQPPALLPTRLEGLPQADREGPAAQRRAGGRARQAHRGGPVR